MQTTATLIHDGWEVSQRHTPTPLWIPATVPGHVHSDLVRAGVIGDPYYRLHEIGVAWVDKADWVYKTQFMVSKIHSGKQFLVFHGIDTLGRIFLNDNLLGDVRNYFQTYRFDVTEALKSGENKLVIELDSALRIGQEKAVEYLGDGTSVRGKQTYFNFSPRAFVRKPQYMFGWDWGPELVSVGIPGKIELISASVAEITDWEINYELHSTNLADISLSITVQKYDNKPLIVGCALYAAGDNTPDEIITGPAGEYTVHLEILDQEIVRWSPNGRGSQKRYLLNLRVRRVTDNPREPELITHKGLSIGFREILLDTTDGGMAFVVNGEKFFAKGANWIPDGNFPGEITKNQLRERLTQARDAGFNMLRVWGGGLYESEDFYDLCDSLGLLVWQDFAFACSMYPDDLVDFVESVQIEAIQNVKRLRHRVCLCLWCGGNENLELFQSRWSGADQATEFFGGKLIFETLPEVLKKHDPKTPYLPNSPWGDEGEGNCQSENVGDAHYWNVWHAKEPTSNGDWTNYAKSTCRFSSEFGFAAPAGLAAWNSCLAPEDKGVRSLASQWHDKTRKGYETYLKFIAMHFPAPETFDELVYFGQANQAMALTFGIEHWRRQMGHCWGTLYWQLNDCWPTHSWATVDSAGEPKLSYWAVKKSYAALLLSLVRTEKFVEAHLVSDLPHSVSGVLRLQLVTFTGEVLSSVEKPVETPVNAASGSLLEIPAANRNDAFVTGEFLYLENKKPQFQPSYLLLCEPKELQKREINITKEIAGDLEQLQTGLVGDSNLTIVLSVDQFAAFVYICTPKRPGTKLSNNGFHLAPGQSFLLHVYDLAEDMTLDDALDLLEIRYL